MSCFIKEQWSYKSPWELSSSANFLVSLKRFCHRQHKCVRGHHACANEEHYDRTVCRRQGEHDKSWSVYWQLNRLSPCQTAMFINYQHRNIESICRLCWLPLMSLLWLFAARYCFSKNSPLEVAKKMPLFVPPICLRYFFWAFPTSIASVVRFFTFSYINGAPIFAS